MNSIARSMICRLLMAAMVVMPFQAVHAGMIGTDRVISLASPGADRAAVLSIINRSEVQSQLQAMGIDPKAASDRVMALTDQEAGALAGSLHALPAGGEISGLTYLIAVVMFFFIYYNYFK